MTVGLLSNPSRAGFPKPTGIRAALLENYEEVRTIPAASPEGWYRPSGRVPYELGVTSVLEPRKTSSGPETRGK